MLGQLGELLQLAQGQLERLADLPHGRLEPVGGEGADEPRVLGPVALVDAEDQLLTDVAREVQVDIGDAAERLVEEAAQEQVVLDRVDVREPDQVADDRGDRRAPSPPRRQPRAGSGRVSADFTGHLGREVHDVAVDEEEARQAVQVDEAELGVEPLLRIPFLVASGLVELRDARQTDRGERLERPAALRALEVRELVAQVLGQVERGTPLRDQERVRERLGTALEAMAHLPGLGEVEEPVRPPGAVCAVQRRPAPDRDEHVLEAVALGTVVVDVARGHDAQTQTAGQAGERLVPHAVAFDGIVLELDEDVAGTERAHEPPRERFAVGHGRVERGRDGALRAPRQQDQALGQLQQ